MDLIDDGFLRWAFERSIIFPVIAVCVDDNRSHGCCQVILRSSVDENLVSVKPVARLDAGWPIHAEGIMSAGRQSFYKNMPEVKGLVDIGIKLDDLEGRRVIMILKEEQFHARRLAREDGKVNSRFVWSGAQGMRRAFGCTEMHRP